MRERLSCSRKGKEDVKICKGYAFK